MMCLKIMCLNEAKEGLLRILTGIPFYIEGAVSSAYDRGNCGNSEQVFIL